MSIFTFLVALPFLAIIYLPVYLPLLISFWIRSTDWREFRISLQMASLISLLFLLAHPTRPRAPLPIFGNDVAGNMHGAIYHMKQKVTSILGLETIQDFFWHVGWIWLTGWLFMLMAAVTGMFLRAQRLRHQRQSM